MTDLERKFMQHLKLVFDMSGEAEARLAAKRFAALDHFELSRLPDLLNHALEKKRNATA